MSNLTLWPKSDTKRLNLGGGGKGMEFVFGGLLIVIIVIALVLTFWRSGSSTPKYHNMWHCEDCGEFDWRPTAKDFGETPPPMMMEGPQLRITCPKCGEKEALRMTECPKCGKFYVSPRLEYEEAQFLAMRTGQPGPEGPPPAEICPDPDCGTDRRKYLMEQRRK